ncbi:unnamed protein product, partial [Allacma fusca]
QTWPPGGTKEEGRGSRKGLGFLLEVSPYWLYVSVSHFRFIPLYFYLAVIDGSRHKGARNLRVVQGPDGQWIQQDNGDYMDNVMQVARSVGAENKTANQKRRRFNGSQGGLPGLPTLDFVISEQESSLIDLNNTLDQNMTWEDLAWLRRITKLPIILKGIMSPEDAKIAVECGIDAVFVSNHGGRQLDSVLATIDALP